MQNRKRLESIARVLVLAGVAAWLPYGLMKYILHMAIPIKPFLIWHLCGVIPGTVLKYVFARKRTVEKDAAS